MADAYPLLAKGINDDEKSPINTPVSFSLCIVILGYLSIPFALILFLASLTFFLITILQGHWISYGSQYHQISIVDEETGRGVPMVKFLTSGFRDLYSDSNGIVAFYEVGKMSEESKVFFWISSHGYSYKLDGFGVRGVVIDTQAGKATTLSIHRDSLAERLYRITGSGIFRDTFMLGLPLSPSIRYPLTNSEIEGIDSIQTTFYKGKLYCFYGDTERQSYGLGNFHVSGGIVDLSTTDPDQFVNVDFFQQSSDSPLQMKNNTLITKSFVKSLAPIPPLDQPTWIHGLLTLKDHSNIQKDGTGEVERVFAGYYKPAMLNQNKDIRLGILEWDDREKIFRELSQVNITNQVNVAFPFQLSHTLYVNATIEENQAKLSENEEYVYFTYPYALIRVKATVSSFLNLTEHEGYSPLVEGSNGRVEDDEGLSKLPFDRDPYTGKLRYGWKKNTTPLSVDQILKLLNKTLTLEDITPYILVPPADNNATSFGRTMDHSIAQTPQAVMMKGGSIQWNQYKRKYIMIGTQVMGTSSFLGEQWYAESDRVEGPWRNARKIITHDQMTFYNPMHHPYYDKGNGRYIYLEGTYVNTYTTSPPTPYYNYNQQMYKLDLAKV